MASVTASYDLIIIGGGPAGAAAAITAVRGGASVLLLERGRFPRHKVCGEFVSSEALGLLGSLLGNSADTRPLLPQALRIVQARLFLDGRVIVTPIEPAAASIARLDLDAALWQAAVSSGVDARQQTAVEEVGGSEPFTVKTDAGVFVGRSVINATGRWSNLGARNPIQEPPGKEKWLGVKAHFAEPDPAPSTDLYFFAGGYCGVQPVRVKEACGGQPEAGRINVCAMVRADVASTLAEVLDQCAVLRGRSRQWQALSAPVSTSPLIFRRPEPVQDGVLMAGDAAGFVDPFVGNGISLALRSGAAAADSLLRFLRGDASLTSAGQGYRQGYSQRLLPVFRNSSRIRTLLKLPGRLRAPLLNLLESAPRLAEYLVQRTR